MKDRERDRPWTRAAAWMVGLALLAGCGGPADSPGTSPPYSPQEALKTFELVEGYRIELVAAEPLVTDPVAMEIDEHGRLFVVEMPGYPLDTSPSGKVKLLEDTDRDGVFDRATVFADGLVLPTGVMRWREGVVVTAAPDVWYLRDSDGDGRADQRQVLLTGFPFSNPQHTVSDPIYGLDNWIYLANEPAIAAIVFQEPFGDRGTPLSFPDRPDLPAVENPGRNVRFRPDTYQLEFLSGTSQFGHSFDSWGRHFTVHNGHHLRHEVLDARYLKRNPHLLVPTVLQSLPDHGDAAAVYPISRRPRLEILTDVGQFTSACGLVVYQGDLLPPGPGTVSFVAEPVHNLVHRDVWAPRGVSFTASRMEEGREFLASTDGWFRPVFLYNGPEGALYLVDYYREFIEHPEWMSREVYEKEDLYRGRDRGRIYRILPSPAPAPALKREVSLGRASLQELVEALAHPNLWWRRNAQRLLVDRKDPASEALLRELFRRRPSGVARVHVLWTLEGLGRSPLDLILQALEDAEAGVRENAIRLIEFHLSGRPELVERLLQMREDPDPRVRFQLLCTLGELEDPAVRRVRHELLFRDVGEPWMQVAALSARGVDPWELFSRAVQRLERVSGPAEEALTLLLKHLSTLQGTAGEPQQLRRVLAEVRRLQPRGPQMVSACLQGLADGLERVVRTGGKTVLRATSLFPFLEHESVPVRRAALRLLSLAEVDDPTALAALLQRAAGLAENAAAEPERRADAVLLLEREPEAYQELLQGLLKPGTPEPVQAAAASVLGRIRGEEIGRFLLERWQGMTPLVRSRAAQAIFRDRDRIPLMVDALEGGDVRPSTLEFRFRRALIMHPEVSLRERARRLLEKPALEQERVLQEYRRALDTVSADRQRGRQVFDRVCRRCHAVAGEGGRFGPDLATIRNRPAEALLTDILVPSRAIAQNYELYVIELHNGLLREGIIAERTPGAVTLVSEDRQEVIPRNEIRRMSASQLSAMPEGLDSEVSPPEMVDLLAFLKEGP